jgi:hypothetical protein
MSSLVDFDGDKSSLHSDEMQLLEPKTDTPAVKEKEERKKLLFEVPLLSSSLDSF